MNPSQCIKPLTIGIRNILKGITMTKVLTGIVPSMDPTLKSCRFIIKFFGPQRFV